MRHSSSDTHTPLRRDASLMELDLLIIERDCLTGSGTHLLPDPDVMAAGAKADTSH